MQKTVRSDMTDVLLNHIPHPAILMKKDGTITASNQIFKELIGHGAISSKDLKKYIEESLSSAKSEFSISLISLRTTLIIEKNAAEDSFFGKFIMHSLSRSAGESKFSMFIQHYPDAIFYLNLEGEITRQNLSAKRFTHSFGKEREVNVPLTKFILEEDHEIHNRMMKQTFSLNRMPVLLRMRDSENEIHLLEVSYIPRIENDQYAGVYVIGQDKTQRLLIEDELKEVRVLLESYFQNAEKSSCILDENGYILKANTAFEQMVGRTKNELIGYSLSHIQRCGDCLDFNSQLYRVRDREYITGFETNVYDKQGNKKIISMSFSPMLGKKGRVIGMLVGLEDITSEKQTEDLLKKSEQLALIGQLAAGVAHEIRNPLTTLKGFMQLLREEMTQRAYFDVILDELQRIELITGEFLSLAKPHSIHFKQCSINKLLFEVAEFINIECLKNNVTLEVHVHEFMEVMCDIHQLKQVLLNIMKNALEAMPKGGELNIHLKRYEQMAIIQVKDSGIGIPEHRLKHLGEPFYSTKEKGTGLGLMISNKIIKEHKGNFVIESIEGEGTSVILELPLV
ncbi:PAS domain-containing sensor histidine kinase [Falsibacillus pallidus]|uniref:histidine kinase n=1 Tax=Falsibacillus pallidus TaxID=493781 RepID=A0A370GEY2_9BACI|nr:PAS domain-containing sensor histidine kinase [Falsibacillus pallidus]RDI42241.1 PAS domain S-box-containing protein [Falsibacillus pallidus]